MVELEARVFGETKVVNAFPKRFGAAQFGLGKEFFSRRAYPRRTRNLQGGIYDRQLTDIFRIGPMEISAIKTMPAVCSIRLYSKKRSPLLPIAFGTKAKRLENFHGAIKLINQKK